jgi:hypothetical protein
MDSTNDASWSTYLFDDFTVPVNHIWNVTGVEVYGEEQGVSSLTAGIHMRVTAAPHHSAAALASFDQVGPDGLVGGNISRSVTWSLTEGHYYLSVWVERDFMTAGQWNWRGRRPAQGDGAWAHNPLGGLIGILAPTPIHQVPVVNEPNPYDLCFKLDGTDTIVPEPATWLVLGLALLPLVRRRVQR